jgi:hypothetical protein
MTPHIRDEVLSAYLDGEIEARRERNVENHLAACEACRARLTAMRGLVVQLRRAPRLSPPPDLAYQVKRRVLQQTPVRAFESVRSFLAGLPLHAALRPVLAMAFAMAIGLALVRVERETGLRLLGEPEPLPIPEQVKVETILGTPPLPAWLKKTTSHVEGRVFVLTEEGVWVEKGLEGYKPQARIDVHSPQGRAVLTQLSDVGLLLSDGHRVVLRYNLETLELSAPRQIPLRNREERRLPPQTASLIWPTAQV